MRRGDVTPVARVLLARRWLDVRAVGLARIILVWMGWREGGGVVVGIRGREKEKRSVCSRLLRCVFAYSGIGAEASCVIQGALSHTWLELVMR